MVGEGREATKQACGLPASAKAAASLDSCTRLRTGVVRYDPMVSRAISLPG
jgi:hypothetical protein